MNVQTIAKINDVNIIIIKDGEKRVPIKPICEALGVDYSSQLKKIKDDDILTSTMVLSTTVGRDKKDRDMQTIPYKYVFGWLFGINPKNVSEQARPIVLKYKMACYDALYYHFTAHSQFLEEKQIKMEELLNEVQRVKKEFTSAKANLKEAEDKLKEVRDLKFEHWDAERKQLSLALPESGE